MVVFCFGNHDTSDSSSNSSCSAFSFTFAAAPLLPLRKFCFENIAREPPARSFKRRRPLWDVDGGTSEGKKKRRLRLNLITSRLSRPFSAPATNIVDRGISKIAIWAKGKRLDKNHLRKSAIMNRVKTSLDAAKATASLKRLQEIEREAPAFRQVIVQKPRCFEGPIPSPLGLSNYDALDLEDEVFDEEGEEEGSGSSRIYTDFNIMKPYTASDSDDYDYLDELDGIPHDLPDEPPPLPDERIVDMLKEKERQREVCFVQFVA